MCSVTDRPCEISVGIDMATLNFNEIFEAYIVWWVSDKYKVYPSCQLISQLLHFEVVSFPQLFLHWFTKMLVTLVIIKGESSFLYQLKAPKWASIWYTTHNILGHLNILILTFDLNLWKKNMASFMKVFFQNIFLFFKYIFGKFHAGTCVGWWDNMFV
jgi:hypothetical protein